MKYYKYSMNMTLLNIFCVILFIPIFIIIYLLDLESSIDFYFLILYILWMFLHELLHGIGFIVNKDVNRKNIVYGACLEKGIMYCMCKQKINKKSIMISTILPFAIIGVFTLLFGFIINNKLLQILSLFNIVGCIGDIIMFFNFLKLPDFLYTDLDDCTGFVLISKYDLSEYKTFGLKLVKVENENNLEFPKNHKKISFSKISWIIFLIFIVLFILCFFKNYS